MEFTCDSRLVTPGMIFFAVPCHDVERHVIEAISKGAFLVVLERGNADLASVNGVLCEVISEDLNCESIGGFIEKIKPSEDGPSFIGPLSKPSKSEFWEGDTEHRSGAYLDVREHSSTGSTYPKTDFEEFGKRSIITTNVRRLFALFCGTAYSKRPSKIIGVTGTNGKTSTVSFVSQILSLLGIRAVSIGTLGVVPGLKTDSYHTDIDSPQLTSFDPLSLHRALHQLAEREVQCAAIECTSHGLDQSRLDALDFDAVALTNVTQDHLDYHKTMHQYAAAKTRLFGVLAKNSAVAVFEGGREHVGFSGSNEFCEISIEVAKSRGLQIKFFSLDSGADVCVTRYVQQGNHFILDISINDQLFTNVAFNLVGKIQIKNLLCAIGLILGAYNDIQAEDIVRVIQLIQQVPGRLELVQKYNGANIFVDYCHTPDALEQALASLEGYGSAGDANQQGKARGKIHIVIGCGGERDKGKRRQIGEIAARYDTLIITDDNPRSEDPAEIRREILNGALGGKAEVVEIPDRAEAILYGVNMVKPGDLLLIAGRGHERFQKVNGQNIPFHDGEFVQKCVDDSASVLRLS